MAKSPKVISGDAIEAFIKSRRKPTINDVARLAVVSKKTVSRVINKSPSVHGRTRDAINEVIERIGFRPDPQARGLASGRAFLIGLIYDNPNAAYIVNMLNGALDALRGSGTELVVHPCDRTSESFLEDIRDFVELQRLAGVIILPPIAENRQLLAVLDELNVPYARITAMHGKGQTPPVPGRQVVSRDRDGCRSAAERLVELGHRHIGFIAGPEGYASAVERRAGFIEGLEASGTSFYPQYEAQGAYSFESGYAAAQKILAHPGITAIFACNDEMAIGAYKAAFEKGLRIPEDLSLIGFDDAPIAARVYPPLTTVRLPIRDMGRAAAEMLIDPDYNRDSAVIFDSTLVERESSGERRWK